MTAFQVVVDDDFSCIVGLEEAGLTIVTATILTREISEPQIYLSLGAVLSQDKTHYRWTSPPAHLNSEIRIKVVDAVAIDEATSKSTHSEDPDRSELQRLVREWDALAPQERIVQLSGLVEKLSESETGS